MLSLSIWVLHVTDFQQGGLTPQMLWLMLLLLDKEVMKRGKGKGIIVNHSFNYVIVWAMCHLWDWPSLFNHKPVNCEPVGKLVFWILKPSQTFCERCSEKGKTSLPCLSWMSEILSHWRPNPVYHRCCISSVALDPLNRKCCDQVSWLVFRYKN